MSTRNFADSELVCRCGCGSLPTAEFQDALQTLRDAYDRPMLLSSCQRCAAHNELVSARKSRTGPHTIGAVDVLVSGADAYDLIYCATLLGWYGIGPNQKGSTHERFVHLDRRPKAQRRYWTY